MNFTFNWFYADDRDIAYFNSGDNPVRATRRQTQLPDWGTGQCDWKSFDPDNLQTAHVHAASASTRRRSTRTT